MEETRNSFLWSLPLQELYSNSTRVMEEVDGDGDVRRGLVTDVFCCQRWRSTMQQPAARPASYVVESLVAPLTNADNSCIPRLASTTPPVQNRVRAQSAAAGDCPAAEPLLTEILRESVPHLLAQRIQERSTAPSAQRDKAAMAGPGAYVVAPPVPAESSLTKWASPLVACCQPDCGTCWSHLVC